MKYEFAFFLKVDHMAWTSKISNIFFEFFCHPTRTTIQPIFLYWMLACWFCSSQSDSNENFTQYHTSFPTMYCSGKLLTSLACVLFVTNCWAPSCLDDPVARGNWLNINMVDTHFAHWRWRSDTWAKSVGWMFWIYSSYLDDAIRVEICEMELLVPHKRSILSKSRFIEMTMNVSVTWVTEIQEQIKESRIRGPGLTRVIWPYKFRLKYALDCKSLWFGTTWFSYIIRNEMVSRLSEANLKGIDKWLISTHCQVWYIQS